MIDVLSQVLGSVRLVGGVFLEAQFTAPWCTISQVTADDIRPFVATPGQIIAYHFVIAGRLICELEDGESAEISAGEVVLMPRNDRHTLASAPGLPAVSAEELIRPGDGGGIARIDYGGGGEPTHLVCGFLATEEVQNPLISGLPPMLRLDMRDGASREWVEASVRFAARELANGKFGASHVMSRLSELLFFEAVRDYAATLADSQLGWLGGLRDPQIGRALALLHGRAGADWTIERLAREVSMSRSAFNERFSSLVGMPPIRYLTHWRLQLAREQLRDRRRPIARIAQAAGYESEVAFNRAFKRAFGQPPARWRGRNA
ncbi:MAG: AraC family transcriptional regulator [Pseudomonadota bacterium]